MCCSGRPVTTMLQAFIEMSKVFSVPAVACMVNAFPAPNHNEGLHVLKHANMQVLHICNFFHHGGEPFNVPVSAL